MTILIVLAALTAAQVDPETIVKEGFALLEKNQHAEAAAKFDTCAAMARDQSNRVVEGECTRGRGRAAQARRDYAAARAFYESAHELLAAAGDHASLGRNFNDRAFLAFVEARWLDVREFYTRAADAYGAAGMKVEQAMALRGSTFAQGMPLDDRKLVLARAAAIAREAKHARTEALVLHHWGDMLFLQGEYEDSLEKTQAAVALLDTLDDPVSIARALTSLGRLHRVLNQPRQAIAVYRRVLAIQEKTDDISGQAQTYGAIGTALSAAGSRESIQYFDKALALARQTGNRSQINFLLASSAFGFGEIGEYARALAVVDEALASNPGVDDLAPMYGSRGDALRGLKRYNEAIVALTQALEHAQKLGSTEWQLDSLIQRADAYAKLGRTAEARADLDTTVAMIETQRAKLPPSDFFKRGFGDKYQDALGWTVALTHASGQHLEALTLSEQARGRALLDLLASRDGAQAVEPLTMRGGAPAADVMSAAAAPAPTAGTLEQVTSRLHTTLMSYWVNDDAAFVWVTRPDGAVVSRRIPATRAQLQRLVRRTWSFGAATLARRGTIDDAIPDKPAETTPADRALAAVTMRGGDPLAPTGQESRAYRELYDLLVAPVRSALPRGSDALITIVPHGPLFELSFAALLAPNGRHLLEDYRIHYAPSAATLEFTARRRATKARQGYLFVANPLTPPVKPPLPPLPGAEREVRAVSQLVGASRSTLFSGKSATEDVVRNAIGNYRVVHFATHGLVSSENPFESYLALAPAAPDDGKLTAAEIQQLKLSADLVVLSACRAAGGKISGDGIVGLTRAFFTAGTPSILAALWDMADESAEHLLPRFYAEWQKTNDKGQALRAAQLSMLRDLRAGTLTVNTPFGALPLPPHPALWANLVLIGEPK